MAGIFHRARNKNYRFSFLKYILSEFIKNTFVLNTTNWPLDSSFSIRVLSDILLQDQNSPFPFLVSTRNRSRGFRLKTEPDKDTNK